MIFLLVFAVIKTKNPLLASRGQEIPVVPPQFTPAGASWDPNRSAGCIGPYPSFPTVCSGKPLRKVFGTLGLTALQRPAALCQIRMVLTGFHHCVAVYSLSLSLPPQMSQVNKKFLFFLEDFPSVLKKFSIVLKKGDCFLWVSPIVTASEL